jgi:uncharacterized RDD family membrane protein YckC
MASSVSIPPPGYVPPPPPAPDELMTGAPVDRALLDESRRKLDTRRLVAWIIDGLVVGILTVPLVLYFGTDLGTTVPIAASMLAYYFLFDVTTGQSIGKRARRLRVVMADGSPVTVRAASARSVLLILDSTLIGLAVYLLSRGRRRRIGDYAAGTIVCDVARVGTFRRPLRGVDLLYPLAWVATGIVVLALTATGHTSWSYRARADGICAGAHRFLAHRPGGASPTQVLGMHTQLWFYLRRMDAPRNWGDRHQELLRRLSAENDALANIVTMRGGPDRATAAAFQVQLADDRVALQRLGYRSCAAAV